MKKSSELQNLEIFFTLYPEETVTRLTLWAISLKSASCHQNGTVIIGLTVNLMEKVDSSINCMDIDTELFTL